MKKKLLVAAIVMMIAVGAQAQKSEGFGMQATIGYGFNLQKNYPGLFQISAMPGWYFSSRWFAGLGLSYNLYTGNNNNGNGNEYGDENNGNSSSTVIPIFAHATFNITEGTKVIPFLNLKMGYGIHSEKVTSGSNYAETSGGFYFSPAFGIHIPVAPGVSLSPALVYEAQSITGKLRVDDLIIKSTPTFNNLMLRLGIGF